MKARKFGYDVAYERRPSVHPLHVSQYQMSGYFVVAHGGSTVFYQSSVKKNHLKFLISFSCTACRTTIDCGTPAKYILYIITT